jgi:hypothetical protein
LLPETSTLFLAGEQPGPSRHPHPTTPASLVRLEESDPAADSNAPDPLLRRSARIAADATSAEVGPSASPGSQGVDSQPKEAVLPQTHGAPPGVFSSENSRYLVGVWNICDA